VTRIAEILYHTDPQAQPGTSSAGGATVYTREIATAAARQGHEVHTFTRRENPFVADQVTVEPGYVVHYVTAGPLRPLERIELLDYLDTFRQGVAAIFDRIGNPDAIHANYWLAAMVGHALKHERSIPLVVTFHTLELVKADHFSGESPMRAVEEKAIFDCADVVLASCELERDQFVHYYDADPTRIAVVPLGVDRAFFAPGDRAAARDAVGMSRAGILLLYVGRIQRLKGVELALETLIALDQRGHNVTLALIGGPSGPGGFEELSALRQRVAEARVSHRVRFLAPQTHVALSSWMRAASVTLVPSRSESFGLVALESSSCGTPVVASRVGGLTTLIQPRVNGVLLEDRSPRAWADAVEQVVVDDQVGHFAQAPDFARQFSWAGAARALVEVIDERQSSELVSC